MTVNKYHLTLPKGLITYRNSNTKAVWSPCNPNDIQGWNQGDILIINCTLDLNPANVDPMPPSDEYVGLCAGACNSNDTDTIKELIEEARNIRYPNPGELLGFNEAITTETTANPENIFYCATEITGTFPLKPSSRGVLENYVYHRRMVYKGKNTVADGNSVEIVFGYGDLMDSEVKS